MKVKLKVKKSVYRVIPVKVFMLLMAVMLVMGCGEEKMLYSGTPLVQLKDAWRLYRWGEYDQAEKLFRQLKKKLKGNQKLYLQALYGLAITLSQRTPAPDTVEARKLYDEIIRLAPNSGIAAWASLDNIRMDYFEKQPKEELIEGYGEVVRRYPETLASDEAFLYQQALLLTSMEPEKIQKVITQLQKEIPRKKTSPNLEYYYLMQATAYDLAGEPQNQITALEAYIGSLRKDPDYPKASNNVYYYWQIATLAEFKVGDFALARKYYRKILKEYPKDHRIYGIELALRRMDKLETELMNELKTENNK